MNKENSFYCTESAAVLFAFVTVLTLLTMIEEKKRFINKLEIKIEKVVNF